MCCQKTVYFGMHFILPKHISQSQISPDKTNIHFQHFQHFIITEIHHYITDRDFGLGKLRGDFTLISCIQFLLDITRTLVL